jgi:hypothetical protein
MWTTTSKYPIYIISKGRYKNPLTARAMDVCGIQYRIVVEPSEYDDYCKSIDENKIIVLPNNFSEMGQGSIPVRNWVWEHSIKEGFDKHWIVDDNICKFMRLNNNKRIQCRSSKIFRILEDFTDRYSNVGLSGFNYQNFAHDRVEIAPYKINTRIYSCILIDNKLPFRWRGKYNEDTDLSLNVLKSGLCTILFNALLIDKTGTGRNDGGNENIYSETNKRKEFAQSLQKQHPDIVKVTWKFNRWHHSVSYKMFTQKLKRREGLILSEKINNYGMELKKIVSLEIKS